MGKTLDRIVRGVGEVLSPTRCAGCERPGELICADCLERFELIDPLLSCTRCASPFGSLLCTECDADRGEIENTADGNTTESPQSNPLLDNEAVGCARVLAAATYAGPVPRIVRAYKDGGERRLGKLIAELMLDCAEHAEARAPERYGGILLDADAATFVPATAEAFARRGFDHMELVCRTFCELAGKPMLDTMIKRGRGDQRKLGRAGRLGQARELYRVDTDVCGMRILLLDDVITTGATMTAAGTALRDAGAVNVDGLALARVW